MKIVILIIIVLVTFNFVLKQTFQKSLTSVLTAACCGLFTVLSVPWAIEQSKAQIEHWQQSPDLMLDTSVLLFIDVFMQIGFALFAAELLTLGKTTRSRIHCCRVLRFFPGVLFLMVLFYLLVNAIFFFTGVPFEWIGWGLGGAIVIGLPTLSWLLKWILPEKEIRLELLFIVSLLIALLGVVATVNGRTAFASVGNTNWLGLIYDMLLAGIAIGAGITWQRLKTKIKKQNKQL